MRYRFLTAAEQELDEAAEFYESRQARLGRRFLNAVDETIQRIVDSPEGAPIAFEDSGSKLSVRRRQTKKFPYSVLYVVDDNEVVIVAVKHTHRATGYWKDRLAEI